MRVSKEKKVDIKKAKINLDSSEEVKYLKLILNNECGNCPNSNSGCRGCNLFYFKQDLLKELEV